MVFVGVDVGTSSVKAVAFDDTGAVLAMSSEALHPTVSPNGMREMDSVDLWNCTKSALRKLADTDRLGERISAISVSSFGEAFVAVDEDGRELGPVMIFTDHRGEEDYYAAMAHTSDEEIARICGLPPSITYSISKLLYLKNHQRDLYDRAKSFLLVGGYVLCKLCGEMAVDYSLASRTMLFDIHKKEWSEKLLDCFDIDQGKLPGAFLAGRILGEVRQDQAQELHISAKALLVLGGHDQPVCAFAAGMGDMRAVNSLGTSQCITPLMRSPLLPETTLEKYYPSEPFVTEGRYCALAYNVSSGLLIDWFLKTFSPGGQARFAEYESRAPQSPTKLFVLPYLAGSGTPYMDHKASFCVTGADPSTTRYDIYRACLEGLCMDMRLNVAELRKENLAFLKIAAVGGGSRSAFWLQIIADILQMPVETLECSEACALGAAMLGAAALKAYPSAEEASFAMTRTKEQFMPQKQFMAYYDEKFALYVKLHASLKPYNDFSNRGDHS
ncbi:MAG: FGGY family carbohydrate kinase [Clostridia bacterium]|nr:FGGY family carbohydrate kinase [Clostridia bacterium]